MAGRSSAHWPVPWGRPGTSQHGVPVPVQHRRAVHVLVKQVHLPAVGQAVVRVQGPAHSAAVNVVKLGAVRCVSDATTTTGAPPTATRLVEGKHEPLGARVQLHREGGRGAASLPRRTRSTCGVWG